METVRPILLVTGADGQLGNDFRAISHEYPEFEFLFAGKMELDITVESWVHEYLKKHRPAGVINCAAYTNVERAEDETEGAMLTNAYAPGFLAAASQANDALFIHYSTDYVFDGTASRPYLETDEVNPLNAYGSSKLEGERLVREAATRYFTIRTSWLYSSRGHNFFRTMLRLAHEKGALSVVEDQVASPTYARSLARDTMSLVEKCLTDQAPPDYGCYHYSQEGIASWYDFAVEIMKRSGLEIPVKPVSSKDFPTKATRPAYSKLGSAKWKEHTGITPSSWQEGLEACINDGKA